MTENFNMLQLDENKNASNTDDCNFLLETTDNGVKNNNAPEYICQSPITITGNFSDNNTNVSLEICNDYPDVPNLSLPTETGESLNKVHPNSSNGSNFEETTIPRNSSNRSLLNEIVIPHNISVQDLLESTISKVEASIPSPNGSCNKSLLADTNVAAAETTHFNGLSQNSLDINVSFTENKNESFELLKDSSLVKLEVQNNSMPPSHHFHSDSATENPSGPMKDNPSENFEHIDLVENSNSTFNIPECKVKTPDDKKSEIHDSSKLIDFTNVMQDRFVSDDFNFKVPDVISPNSTNCIIENESTFKNFCDLQMTNTVEIDHSKNADSVSSNHPESKSSSDGHSVPTSEFFGLMGMDNVNVDDIVFKVPENPPDFGSKVPENPPDFGSKVPESPPDFGSKVPENPPDFGSKVPENPPDFGSKVPENPPDFGSKVPENPPDFGSKVPEIPSDFEFKVPENPFDFGSKLPENPSEFGFKVSEISADTECEEFTDAVQFFKDPSSFHFLENIKTGQPESTAPRSSLYVKFDPLHSKFQTQRNQDNSVLCTSKALNDGSETSVGLLDRSVRDSLSNILISFDSPRVADCRDAKSPVSSVPPKLYTEEDVQQLLKIHELTSQEVLLKKQRELEEEIIKRQQEMEQEMMKTTETKDNKIAQLQKLVKVQSGLLEELAQILSILSGKNKTTQDNLETLDEENKKLKGEIQTLTEDLQSVENTFADFHKRYEQCKGMLKTYKDNEELLKTNLSEQKQMYQGLQEQTNESLEKAYSEVNSVKKASEAQIAVLKAQLKKAELKISSMESDMKQIKIENSQLGGICDDLIQKVGNS